MAQHQYRTHRIQLKRLGKALVIARPMAPLTPITNAR